MSKTGIQIQIPGFEDFHIKIVCTDFTGTLSVGGKLIDGVKARLCQLCKKVDVYVVTSDTRNVSEEELGKILPLKDLDGNDLVEQQSDALPDQSPMMCKRRNTCNRSFSRGESGCETSPCSVTVGMTAYGSKRPRVGADWRLLLMSAKVAPSKQ